MAVQVKRDKRTFLVGMEWELAQDKEDAKSLLKQSGNKGRVAITPPGDDRTWFGYAEASQKGIAAAAVVAEVLQDAIIAAPLPNGQVWLCATAQGMPIPSHDLVIDGDVELVRSRVLEWMGYFPGAAIYADVNGASGTAEEMWQRIDAAIVAGDLSKLQLKRLQVIKPASGAQLVVVLAVVAVIAAGAGGWHFFLREKPLSAAELAKRRAAGQAAQTAASERMRKEAAIYAHFDAIDKRQLFWKDALKKDALAWLAQIDKLPVVSNGYMVERGECNEGGCTIKWKPRGPAPSMAARLKLDGFVPPQDPKTAADAEASSHFAVSLGTRAKEIVIAPEQDKNLAAARWALMDDLKIRLLGMTLSVEPFTPDMVPGVPAAGVPAFEAGNTALIHAGFSGPGAATTLRGYMNYLQERPVVIDKISFEQTNVGALNFKLQARLLTLNAPPKRPIAIEFDGEKAILK